MTSRTLTRLYDTREHALETVADLEAAGFRHEDVGIVATNIDARYDSTPHHAASHTGIGAAIGTLVGGSAGLAAGLGAIVIPGIGPIVAAGALVAALAGAGAGAAAGGLVGRLTDAGVSKADAPGYAEGMRRGGSLVTVHTDDERAAHAIDILNRHHPVDMNRREAEYRADGWRGYEEPDEASSFTGPLREGFSSGPAMPDAGDRQS